MDTRVIGKTTFRLLLTYACSLVVYYIATIDSPHIYFALGIASLVFAIDLLWLQRVTYGLSDKLKSTTCVPTTLEEHLNQVIKLPGLYPLIRQEILVLFYAFFARHFAPPQVNERDSFSYFTASNSNDVFWLVAVTQLPTLPFIHFFIEQQGNALAAWFVTLITLWSVVYFYAQKYAVQFCPIRIHQGRLEYRFGISWRANIPLGNIKSVRLARMTDKSDYFDEFTSPLGSNKNLILEFHSPVKFEGAYLARKCRKKAVLALDNPNALLIALTNTVE